VIESVPRPCCLRMAGWLYMDEMDVPLSESGFRNKRLQGMGEKDER